jgi:Domain of unknown function (DUF6265)
MKEKLKFMKMKKMKTKFTLLILSFCFLACEKQNDIKNHNWLLGTWNASMDGNPFTETWTSKDDYFEGKSELKQDGQVIFSEKIELKFIQDTLNYVVIFNDNGKENKVLFKATTVKDSLLIFENPKNDFPKKIKYELISKDKIKASIHGDDNKSEVFDFSRGR